MGLRCGKFGDYPVEDKHIPWKNGCLEDDDSLRFKWFLFRGHLLVSQGAEVGNKRSILESYLRLSLFSRGCCWFKKISVSQLFCPHKFTVSPGFIDIHSGIDHQISQASTALLPPPSVLKLAAFNAWSSPDNHLWLYGQWGRHPNNSGRMVDILKRKHWENFRDPEI